MIKNLVFDFGKVLVDYDFVGQLRKLFDEQCDLDGFIKTIKTEEQQQREDRGVESFEQMCDNLKVEYPQFSRELEIYKHNYTRLIICEMPGMYDLLIELKQKGYKLYGLSNWCDQVYKTFKQYHIFDLLDGFVVSSDVKVIKPEPEIYDHLLRKFGLKAEECLFADDRKVNIDAALAAGMDGVVFTDTAHYIEDLKVRNIL